MDLDEIKLERLIIGRKFCCLLEFSEETNFFVFLYFQENAKKGRSMEKNLKVPVFPRIETISQRRRGHRSQCHQNPTIGNTPFAPNLERVTEGLGQLVGTHCRENGAAQDKSI